MTVRILVFLVIGADLACCAVVWSGRWHLRRTR